MGSIHVLSSSTIHICTYMAKGYLFSCAKTLSEEVKLHIFGRFDTMYTIGYGMALVHLGT